MRTTVKILLISILLILIFSTGGNAFNVTVESTKFHNGTTALSVSDFSQYIRKNCLQLANTKSAWFIDAELNSKQVVVGCSSNLYRLRRVIEENIFLRNILLKLSEHETILVLDKIRLYTLDRVLSYTLTGSDYYIYMLQRILI